MERQTAFISGGTGLLGINTALEFLNRGYRVLTLARSREKAVRVLPGSDALEIVEGDLEQPEAWFPRLQGCDVLVHTAAYFREYFDRGEHVEKLQALNVDLPTRLTREALDRGVSRVVMISSTGALSPSGNVPAAEGFAAEGQLAHNGYQQSKVRMEKALSALNLPPEQLVVVRPGWMWGPNDFAPTNAAQLILDMAKTKTFQFMDGPAFGIVDARDVATGIVSIAKLEHPNPLYHLAGNNLGPLEAIRLVAAEVGGVKVQKVPIAAAKFLSRVLEVVTKVQGKRNPLPMEGIEVLSTNFPVDSSLAERELGVTFRPFRETAKDAVAFAKAKLIDA